MGQLEEQLDGLLEKYCELLIGKVDNESKEMVKSWMIYSHIAKTMPALCKHWNSSYPDAKEEITRVIMQVKALNEARRKENK